MRITLTAEIIQIDCSQNLGTVHTRSLTRIRLILLMTGVLGLAVFLTACADVTALHLIILIAIELFGQKRHSIRINAGIRIIFDLDIVFTKEIYGGAEPYVKVFYYLAYLCSHKCLL